MVCTFELVIWHHNFFGCNTLLRSSTWLLSNNYIKVIILCNFSQRLASSSRSEEQVDLDNGGANPNKFVKVINCLGFNIVFKDFSNKRFIIFYFTKEVCYLPLS